MERRSTFEIKSHTDRAAKSGLLVGLSHPGMAGMTAADYIVRKSETELIGHVAPADFPSIAPFEQGEPRHHTRLYNVVDSELTVLVGELFIPVAVARPFTDALVEWCVEHGVEDVGILHGVPYPHGPTEHAVFTVSTREYHDSRLTRTDLPPLAGGFLDGVAGELVSRSLDADSPPVGVYVTPAHPPGPDVDAALLLLDAVEGVYEFDVDEAELRQLGEELKRYYTSLSDRIESMGDAERVGSRDFPEDRMYM